MISKDYRKCGGAAALLLLSAAIPLTAQKVSVLTAEYDNGRTASNNSETVLSPATVTASTFGKLSSYTVDGQVVGQPLYVPNVKMTGKGNTQTNVLYVGTMHNTLYAFDADKPGSAPLWAVSLGASVPAHYAGTCPATPFTGPELGILSTPVIDAPKGVIYVVAANPIPGQAAYVHTLHAYDIATGQPRNGGSATINASVPGAGSESSNGAVTLDHVHTIQRPALLLSNGNVYIGFSGCGPDPSPYHGWVLGYSATNVQLQTAAFNSTPNGDAGGIWQSGRGLIADQQGSVYFETGNGSTDDTTDFGDSFVKLTPGGALADWFTPSDAQNLNYFDLDLSTTSPVLMTPDTHLLVGGGKQGVLYVLNSTSLGKSGAPVQTFSGTDYCPGNTDSGCQKIHSLAYLAGPQTSTLYVWGTDDFLRSFPYQQHGHFATTASSQSNQQAGYPGGILSVTSSNGRPGTAVVWALTPGVLHAFDASNVANELWNSNQNGARDALGSSYHFEQYTVANGMVYVPDAHNHVVVYGLLGRH